MMRILGLVLAMMGVLACGALADTVTMDVYSGFNLVGAPLVPFSADPLSVFAGTGLDEYTSSLTRFDSATQTMIGYDPYGAEAYGGVLLGDGAWLWCPTPFTISYNGVPDGVPDGGGNKTDMWISLPGDQGAGAGGWSLIACPFNHDVPFGTDEGSGLGDGIFVTDGTTLKTIEEAENAGWISGAFSYMDGPTQTMYSAGYFYQNDYYLRAGKGYWVWTNVDNLALIIPANT